ncbi:NuA4 histone acetyltransferase subunit [Cadophora gregata]|uniref:NuA4 histone acetyltransferase subunit n=1 Tax=Cadophora gregata TaxID=51156 RepID=UPI0026DD557D|nr:NuA4 histone acetyltransferase subunit [Cadophora gregata]KAK0115639.1 NuA4 histone acetyltransferase subunit [Cadophora gregata f. sp. sojae]KAK0128105.1 NuA4 histone acetyltransferase subunit [Cadophora gregata]
MASQPLNSSMQPTDVYGGDEVSAIILDPGYSSVRAGFAGEDSPKSFLNSHYGVLDSGKFVFGDDAIHNPLSHLEIRNPMSKEGIVEDWDTATQLWEYAITSRLTSFKQADPRTNGLNDDVKDMDVQMEGVEDNEKPLEEHPLLMTETAWNTVKNREKAIEIAMESWGCPAFWLARNSVMAAFGGGKATALVIDVGASTASVLGIHDGLILKKSVQRSHLGGNWLSSQLRAMFNSQDPKIELVPHFMVSSKTAVDAGAPAQAVFRKYDKTATDSFRALEEERVLTEFKESVVQTWSGPGRLNMQNQTGGSNLDFARSQPGRVFEMPDGYNQMWGVERFQVAEGLWDAKAALSVPGEAAVTQSQTIIDMIKASIGAVDVDLRGHLLANIIVTGGTTLINGFGDRLNNELMNAYPGTRIKVQAAGLTTERRFGSWIGGSILGSLGTFHQMWISKAEYAEFGSSVVEKRCK